jgi:hypothetical protein
MAVLTAPGYDPTPIEEVLARTQAELRLTQAALKMSKEARLWAVTELARIWAAGLVKP